MSDDSRAEARNWAYEEFGHAELGDARRTMRLVRMATAAALRPGGTVLEVFLSSAERQAAYDFLANPDICQEDLLTAMAVATASRCESHPFVFVAVDGTSLTLTDRARTKDFGAIGSTANGASGVKVVHAYAVSPAGVPLGILDQQWWSRTRQKKRNDCHDRPVHDKETRYWLSAIEASTGRLAGLQTSAWFQVDREGDRYATLKTLQDSGQWFTVRSTYGSRFVLQGARRRRLAQVLRRAQVRGVHQLDVRARDDRQERTATLRVRTARVVLDMVERPTKERCALPVNVVDVRETGTTPRGEEPIHWRLLTNYPVDTEEDVQRVLFGYAQRWRIEDLHKTWKSGACRVEDTQLRSMRRVVKWAILMVATAARIERIKHLARTEPSRPASVEFEPHEIEATILMKRQNKRRNERIPKGMPTIGQITLWLAELGGYTGKSSGGPPGSVTIRRGLDVVLPVASALERLRKEGKLR
ncbi:IS4 family transposase [Sorangium sp. So ce1389]|uniref:IS4 family transposase n=1 Tax=Sorangium sp. So ce1389 TaxID=3133336 RepID=UPI003F5D94EC